MGESSLRGSRCAILFVCAGLFYPPEKTMLSLCPTQATQPVLRQPRPQICLIRSSPSPRANTKELMHPPKNKCSSFVSDTIYERFGNSPGRSFAQRSHTPRPQQAIRSLHTQIMSLLVDLNFSESHLLDIRYSAHLLRNSWRILIVASVWFPLLSFASPQHAHACPPQTAVFFVSDTNYMCFTVPRPRLCSTTTPSDCTHSSSRRWSYAGHKR